MIRKTIEFSTPGTRLSVAHSQLVVERPDHEIVTLPVEDLGVVIVDDARATYTQSVFLELLDAGATVLVTGRDHLPIGMMLPLNAHHAQTERHRAQVAVSAPVKKRAWQSIIRSKISQQAAVAKCCTGSDGGLVGLVPRVRSGDPDNIEAQAAQRYWRLLFGKSFRRDRHLAGTNALLNYGYAVLRAAISRAIVASGLIPSLGVHHRNRTNPFCLADDLLEPFRPYVDWKVHSLVLRSEGASLNLGVKYVRAELLSLLNETVSVGGRREPLLLGLQSSAASLCRALTGGNRTLALPEGLPLKRDAFETGEPE